MWLSATLPATLPVTLAGARIRVEVDGELVGFVKLPKGGGMAEFELATALPVGFHTVTFLKVTEDNAQKNTKVRSVAAWCGGRSVG